jgi:hypothetical protein
MTRKVTVPPWPMKNNRQLIQLSKSLTLNELEDGSNRPGLHSQGSGPTRSFDKTESERNDDEDSADPYRDHWSFGICCRSNRGAQGWWQAGEAGKAARPNGLQARGNSQGDEALGRRLRGPFRT